MSDLFKSIIGEQLSSVVFVQDYLQLHFDGNVLTCYSWPKIQILDVSFDFQDNGYRDALCAFISRIVNRVIFEENKKLELFFETGYSIMLDINRNEHNKSLPEFAYFTSIEGEWFVLD